MERENEGTYLEDFGTGSILHLGYHFLKRRSIPFFNYASSEGFNRSHITVVLGRGLGRHLALSGRPQKRPWRQITVDLGL